MKTELSRREMQVVQRLAKGMNGPEIAKDLGVGYEGIRNYLRRARRKQGVGSQRELVVCIAANDAEEETLP